MRFDGKAGLVTGAGSGIGRATALGFAKLGGAIAILSAALLYVNLRDGELGTPTLIAGGAAYAAFIAGLGWLGAL